MAPGPRVSLRGQREFLDRASLWKSELGLFARRRSLGNRCSRRMHCEWSNALWRASLHPSKGRTQWVVTQWLSSKSARPEKTNGDWHSNRWQTGDWNGTGDWDRSRPGQHRHTAPDTTRICRRPRSQALLRNAAAILLTVIIAVGFCASTNAAFNIHDKRPVTKFTIHITVAPGSAATLLVRIDILGED